MTEEITEIELLKKEADELGVQYHPNISAAKLQTRILEVQAGVTEPVVEEVTKKPEQTLKEKKNEQIKLIRVRITCMNPLKGEHTGETFSFGNRLVGTLRKFVPYGVDWHVPAVLLETIKEKQYQNFYTVKDDFGRKIRKGKWVNEYAIEYLEPLTETELKELAQRQAMANGTADAI